MNQVLAALMAARGYVFDATNTNPDDGVLTIKPTGYPNGGAWVRQLDGYVSAKEFGARGDGTTDDTAAIQAAINAHGWVFLPAGTYKVTGLTLPSDRASIRIVGHTGTTQGADKRSVLLAAANSMSILTISSQSTSGPPELVVIEDLTLDSTGHTGVTGLHMNKGQNIEVNRVTATYCADGFLIDGTAAASNNRLENVYLRSCQTFTCTRGVYLNGNASVSGALGGLVLVNHTSTSDATGVKIDGSGGIAPNEIQGGNIQASTAYGLQVISAEVEVSSVYIEVVSGDSLNASSGARVTTRNCDLGNPVVDSTSIITGDQSYMNSLGVLGTPQRIGQIYDDYQSHQSWGPPNLGGSGVVYQSGAKVIDRMGVEWLCVTAGTSGNSAFIAPGGRIIRPFTYAEVLNGNLLWYPQKKFILRRVAIVVTTDFSQTSDIWFGTLLNSHSDDILALAQLPYTGLVTDFTADAVNNAQSYALLKSGTTPPLMQGTMPVNAGSIPAGSKISVFKDGTVTAGAGVLIIEGTYLGL
jgi:hypothetical protein